MIPVIDRIQLVTAVLVRICLTSTDTLPTTTGLPKTIRRGTASLTPINIVHKEETCKFDVRIRLRGGSYQQYVPQVSAVELLAR